MKKLIFSVWLLMLSMVATAQTFVVVDKNGNRTSYDVSKLDSVTFQQTPPGFTVYDNAETSNTGNDDDPGQGGDEPTQTVTQYTFDDVQTFSGDPDFLFTHPDTVFVGADGQDFAFQLRTNVGYSYTASEAWLKYKSDVADSDSLRFQAAMNPSTQQRTAFLYFKSSDEKKADTLVVVQYGKRDSRYIDIDWSRTTVESYNRETGRAVLVFQDEVPVMGKYDVTLLPSDDTYSIRLIDGVQQLSDTKVQLDTREGKMGNLFKDQQFTLCSDPNYDPSDSGSSSGGTTPKSSRASAPASLPVITGPIIYPEEIYLCEDGRPVMEVYSKARAPRRSSLEKEYNIFEYKYDNSGETIWEKGVNKVSWNTCTFDVGLKGIFAFDFGDVAWEDVRFGDLQNFKAYLDGDFNTDLILQYELSKGVEAKYEKTLKKDIFSYRVKFMVGPVPVWINLKSDLKASVEAKAEGTVTMTGGVRASATLKGGVEWDRTTGISPIRGFDYQYELVSPEVTAEAHAEAKAYVWPEIKIGIYDVLCPTINPKPYIRAYADARTAEANKPYFGWNAGVSTGADLTLGLSLDLYFWEKDLGEIEPINLVDYDLVAVPTKIELEGDTLSRVLNGTTHEVKYTVKGHNSITGSDYLIPGALVKVESLGGGKIDKEEGYYYTGWDGTVSVQFEQSDTIPGYLKATLVTGDEERDKECRNWHSEVVDFRFTAVADDNAISATRAGKAEATFILEEYTKSGEYKGYWKEAYGYKVGFSATGGKLDADTLITDEFGKVVVNFDGGEGFSGGSLTAQAVVQEFDTLFTQELSIKKFSFDDAGLAKCYNLPNNTLSFDGGYLPVVSKTILEWKKDESEYVVWSPPGYFSFFWEAEKPATGQDVREHKWEHVKKGAGGSHSIEAEVIFDNKTKYDADYQTQHPNRGYWQVPYAGAKYTAYTEWKEVEGWQDYYAAYYEAHGEYPDIPIPDFDNWSTDTDHTSGGKTGVLRFTTAVTGGSGKQILFEEGDTYVFLLYRVQDNSDSVYLKLVFNKSEVIDQGVAY